MGVFTKFLFRSFQFGIISHRIGPARSLGRIRRFVNVFRSVLIYIRKMMLTGYQNVRASDSYKCVVLTPSLMTSPDTRPRTIYLNKQARQMDIPSAALFCNFAVPPFHSLLVHSRKLLTATSRRHNLFLWTHQLDWESFFRVVFCALINRIKREARFDGFPNFRCGLGTIPKPQTD